MAAKATTGPLPGGDLGAGRGWSIFVTKFKESHAMYYEASLANGSNSRLYYYVLCNAALRTATVSRCRKLFSRPHEAIEAGDAARH